MGFRGEVEDRPRLVLGEQAGYQLAIADIAGDEGVPGVAVEAGEVLPVAGVGELVELTTGSSCRASQSSTKLAPMKPALPVTRIVMSHTLFKQWLSVGLLRHVPPRCTNRS